MKHNLTQCPACGYFAFNGIECFDCGYRSGGHSVGFACPRSCIQANERFCRFMPVLGGLGRMTITSHTVKVQTELRDPVILREAIEAMGGTWLGEGSHELFQNAASGHGFKLPAWQYPLVLQADGTLAYDDFQQQWGRLSDLEQLKNQYAVAEIASKATALGWQFEKTADGIQVYHPQSGVMNYSKGILDQTGFSGQDCHAALLELGVKFSDAQVKPEMGQVAAQVHVTE